MTDQVNRRVVNPFDIGSIINEEAAVLKNIITRVSRDVFRDVLLAQLGGDENQLEKVLRLGGDENRLEKVLRLFAYSGGPFGSIVLQAAIISEANQWG